MAVEYTVLEKNKPWLLENVIVSFVADKEETDGKSLVYYVIKAE